MRPESDASAQLWSSDILIIMFWKTWHFLNNIWNGHKENFLIVEQVNDLYEITQACRDVKKKRITIKKSFSINNLNGLKHPFGKMNKIVFSLNSRLATTTESVITLKRSRPQEMMNESELDQLIYQAFWDFLNRYRSMAAKKMATNDSDLISAYIQVREVHLGSHRLFNPVGFKGPEICLRLKGTFIPRTMLPTLERFKNWGQIFVFERGSVLAGALTEFDASRRGPGGFFVQVDERESVVFKIKDEEQIFEGVVEWGTDSLKREIAVDLGIDEKMADSIFLLHFRGMVSERVKRFLDSKISNGLDNLSRLLEPIKKRSKSNRSKFYFNFRMPGLNSTKLTDKLRGVPVRINEELERNEFTLINKPGPADFDVFARQDTLAFLSFEYDLPKFEFLNQLLKRRVRWLIPNF